jgi:hypothetical protein
VDVVSVYFLIISSYVYIIGCGVVVTADVVGYSQITLLSTTSTLIRVNGYIE